MSLSHPFFVLSLSVLLPLAAIADDEPTFATTLKEHRFTPAEIKVPAGKAFNIKITNGDTTADEFDSSSLKVEKLIVGNGDGTVRVRALKPGKYPFTGEYHSDTAQGVVIAE